MQFYFLAGYLFLIFNLLYSGIYVAENNYYIAFSEPLD